MDLPWRPSPKVCKNIPLLFLFSSPDWQKFTHSHNEGNVVNNSPVFTRASRCKPEETSESLIGCEKFKGYRRNHQIRMQRRMMVPFLKYLAGGLPRFMELRNGGPDGPERRRGEQRGGRQCPRSREPSGEASGHHPSVTP